jgi:hypothetical protein
MKNRRIEPGCEAPSAAAPGDATAEPINGATGSPLLTAAAGAAVRDAPVSSRRLAAATVHANGAADGESPLPPVPNHANKLPLNPRTPPAAARGAALITGAAAAAGEAISTTGADEPSLTASTESTTGTTESTAESADGRLTESEFTLVGPATPDTTELGRG